MSSKEDGVRAAIAGVAATALTITLAMAAARLAPAEIQTTFFNGQPFTASTPQKTKFKMVFTADGHVTREPVGKSGAKGEGSWKLSKEGFCTTWKGGQPNCYVLLGGTNKWSVMKGTTVMAIWTK